MGLIAEIYKSSGSNCSADGISNRFNSVTIVNAEGPFDPAEDRPAVLLILGPGNRVGSGPKHVIAVPAEFVNGRWVELKGQGSRMNGGTFIATSDSRYHELVERLGGVRGTAISFHDRFERGR